MSSNDNNDSTSNIQLLKHCPISNINHPFWSRGHTSTISGHRGVIRRTTHRVVPVPIAKGNNVAENAMTKLKMLYDKRGILSPNGWKVTIDLGFPKNNYSSSHVFRVRVRDVSRSGVLKNLNSLCGGDLKLQIQIRCLEDNDGKLLIGERNNLRSKDEKVTLINFGRFGCETDLTRANNLYDFSRPGLGGYTREERVIVKKVSVAVIAILPDAHPFLAMDPSIEDLLCIYRKMLKEEIAHDVTIIPSNGAFVKCHKGLLCTHSSVLNTMFQSKMKESQTNIVEMPDMTEQSVRAFLEYLYVWEVEEAGKNSLIAFEVLHAGHKYDIPKMETCMEKILLSKPNDWYDVEVALRLFIFARNLPNGDLLKLKALQVMKSKFTVLEKSESYQKLFKKDPKAGMDLCKYFFSECFLPLALPAPTTAK